MQYISTRGGISPIPFSDAVLMGLATDGGLLLPQDIPSLRSQELEQFKHLSYQELALEVMSLFIDDIPKADLKSIVDQSYSTFNHSDITPLIATGKVHIQEMFHGPTLAFKDLALQFLGNLFEYILEDRKQHLNVLAATSGDTGSAAIQGLRGKDMVNIFVLHPYKKVSPLQERQMTTVLDDNVYNIAIDGTFDDGQRMIKDAFADIPFKTKNALGAVNSVNWARVLAQVVYYFYGSFQAQKLTGKDKVQFSVPTGNFGNIFAGYIAMKMGAPISKLILATNENDILSRFMSTGEYSTADVNATISPSMDIQVASNFERYLYYQLGENAKALKNAMTHFKSTGKLKPEGQLDPIFAYGKANTSETLKTIKDVYQADDYILDPHTAVGVFVANQYLSDDTATVCLATAHPAKFPDAVVKAIDTEATHPTLEALKDLETRCERLPVCLDTLKEYVESKLASK